ncbi:MAG: 30S ribosomal protein S17 [Planctomycetota bacterium]
MPKRVLTGRVKSDKMDKTRVVQIARLVRHPKYGKIYRDRTTCYVHDENNDSKEGDTVQIIEDKPTSKKKRWSLVKVVQRSSDVDVVAMRAARKQKEQLSSEVEANSPAEDVAVAEPTNEQPATESTETEPQATDSPDESSDQ